MLSAPTFPLSVSANHRHLVDAKNQPFFYQADTPWMLMLNLTLPETREYFDDRKAKGFSVLQVMFTGFYGMKNRDGHLPFENDDFAKPTEEFWAHNDAVVKLADEMGLFLMIAPLWSGCCGEGWAGQKKEGGLKPLNLNGEQKARDWGRWLGARYGGSKNVAWLLGGDKNPGESHELIRQLGQGLHEVAPQQLKAVHNAPEHSSATFYDDQPWLSFNAAYTYGEVFSHIQGEWNRPKTRPIFLSESGYENESNDGRGGVPFRMRRQAYGAILSGALGGHAYGNRDGWRVNEKWRDALKDPGGAQMKFVREFFEGIAWWKLEPQAAQNWVTQGRGEVGKDDFLSAAKAPDNTLGALYIPVSRAFSLDLSKFQAPIRARWFDPTSGEFQSVSGVSTRENQSFTPPQTNAAGESDWILLLQNTS